MTGEHAGGDIPPIRFSEGPGDPAQYAALFETTGWNDMYRRSPAELEAALAASWYVVSAHDRSELVGSARLVSDGVLYAVVFDMIVAPTHQRRGIGSRMLRHLLERCEEAGIRDVLLFAARDTADFYGRFGFVPRPAQAPGMILRRV